MDNFELDPDFAADERVFHYTSAEGLYGILESGCFWATHFQFLNDSKEFVAARDSLVLFIKKELHRQFTVWKINKQIEFVQGEDLAALAEHEATTIIDSMYDVTYNRLGNPFVFSGFCCSPQHADYENGGLLNWAMYGQKGGYAIRINPHKLANLLRDEAKRFAIPLWRCAKVVYSTDQPSHYLERDYRTIADVSKNMVERSLKNDMVGLDLSPSAAPFSRISSLLKDVYFRGEAEARIALVRPHEKLGPENLHELRMRHRSGVAIPYIELFKGLLFEKHSPIEAILIGPHSERERRKNALDIFLRSRGLQSIQTIDSKVPYVS